MKITSLIITILCISGSVFAQQNVQADRPGFGFSTSITPVGMYGIEAGVTTSEFGTNVGELFIRAGLMDKLEIQFEAGSIFFPDGGDSFRSAQFGIVKYNLFSNASNDLRITLLSRTILPFLNTDFSETFTQLILLGDISLTDQLSMNTNVGYGNYIFSDFDIPTYYFTLNPGFAINSSTSAYVGFSFVETEFFDNKNYEMGVSYLIHSNSQIDLGLVFDEESDTFLKIGVATRF